MDRPHRSEENRIRPQSRPHPPRATALPAAPGPALGPAQAAPRTPEAVASVQRLAGNRAAALAVQRAREEAPAPAAPAAPARQGQAEQPADQPAERADPAAEVIERLTRSIEEDTVVDKAKRNVFSPRTWWPEQWLVEGPVRLRRVLERRIIGGKLFSEADLNDITTLSRLNPKWLRDTGIGLMSEAETYIGGELPDYSGWLQLSPGKRLLIATLAFHANHPGKRAPGTPAPISPDYTLGRFLMARNLPEDERRVLDEERDQQIRETAIDTLHPAGLPRERRHALAETDLVSDYAERNRQANEILTAVLLVLQHGLQIYDPEAKKHVPYGGDVIRALAHGGRVNIRIPALRDGDDPMALTDFLGATRNGQLTEATSKRAFATHRTSIGKNKEGEEGTFQEKGGTLASLTNMVTPSLPERGVERPRMMGVDIAGGGLGSRDWNGEVVLPNGSHGHMLLVFTPPTRRTDGSLLVGIETVAPGKPSPVGYKHDFRSTEATANPESVLHGHKGDKVGKGGLKNNERYVDLRQMGGDGGWRAFLEQVKREWYAELERTQDGSAERRRMYERLVGPRQNFRSGGAPGPAR